jgi:hypothetical protein
VAEDGLGIVALQALVAVAAFFVALFFLFEGGL